MSNPIFKMNILFIFRRFNDLDHIAPLANLISENFKFKIYILSINDDIDICKIPLITRLKKNKNIICGYTSEYIMSNWMKLLFQILNKKSNFQLVNKILIKLKLLINALNNFRSSSDLIIKLKIKNLFLDFPYNNKNTKINCIIKTCKNKNIPVIGFHHAVWTRVLEYQGVIDPRMKKMFDQQKKLSENYEKIIVGNKDFENNLQVINNGQKKFISLGSLRFTKTWQDELFSIYGLKKNLGFKNQKKLKILYIDHSAKHGLVGDKILKSLNTILGINSLELVIKPNTSSDFKNKYDLSSEELISLEKYFSKKNTLTLINEFDVVINTFSSAAVDAYLLNKYLIIPKFFFITYTQYQKFGSCFEVNNEQELLKCIISIKDNKINKIYSSDKVNNFMKSIIFNDQDEATVYKNYRIFLEKNLSLKAN